MSHTTPKMLEALHKLRADAAAPIHSATLRALREQTLIQPAIDGIGWNLTARGREAIGAEDFQVQQRIVEPGKEEAHNWKRVASFAGQEAAETYASRLSVANHALYRVPLPDGQNVVFNYGQRSIEQGGVVTAEPPSVEGQADDEQVLFLFRIQRRLSHTYNQGRFESWDWYNTTRYIELSEAEEAARESSAADTDAYEYRVIAEDYPTSSAFVYCHGETRVDAGLLEALVTIALRDDATISFAQRRIDAAARVIAAWAFDRSTLAVLVTRLQELQNAQS